MIAAHDTQAQDLHGAIMNLPCTPPVNANINQRVSYKLGHRDAQHAAAELALAALASLASRLQEQEGQPALSERLNGEGIGDLIFAMERWKSAHTGDASTSALNALEALIVRLAATLAAGSQAVQVPEATQDELLELAEALERRRCITISETVRTEQTRFEKDGKPTAFSAGFTLACEEIAHRIEHEEWVFQDPETPLQPLAGGELTNG